MLESSCAKRFGKEEKMEFKIYDTLPQEAVLIRETVFVKEQGFYLMEIFR